MVVGAKVRCWWLRGGEQYEGCTRWHSTDDGEKDEVKEEKDEDAKWKLVNYLGISPVCVILRAFPLLLFSPVRSFPFFPSHSLFPVAIWIEGKYVEACVRQRFVPSRWQQKGCKTPASRYLALLVWALLWRVIKNGRLVSPPVCWTVAFAVVAPRTLVRVFCRSTPDFQALPLASRGSAKR